MVVSAKGIIIAFVSVLISIIFLLFSTPSYAVNTDEYYKEQLESIEVALKKIDRINRRIRFVKSTFFYKEVSKAKLESFDDFLNALLENRARHRFFL